MSSLPRFAKDFGIHFTTLYSWMKKADIENGDRPGTAAVQSAELRDAKPRIRTLEQEVDSLTKSRLAVTALENAVARRGDVAGCVVDTDRGSQSRSRKFVRALGHHDMVGTMGRVGVCGENAAMDYFFAPLQKNVLDRRQWAPREELPIAIVTWIERTYHRRRRQDRIGRMIPIEFETIMSTQAFQTA